jgi:uncharacterized protein YjdB
MEGLMRRAISVLACACVPGFGAACYGVTAAIEPISVSIDQQIGALTVCTKVQLTVTVTSVSGEVTAPDSVRWTSSDPASASVSSSGMLEALKATPEVTIGATAYAGRSRGTASRKFGIPAFPTSCGSS